MNYFVLDKFRYSDIFIIRITQKIVFNCLIIIWCLLIYLCGLYIFDIDSTLHKSRNHYTVYIKVDSAKKLYPKIKNYIVPSMRYKFEKKILSLYNYID